MEKYSCYYSLVSYLESNRQVENIISIHGDIIDYAYIKHDKDVAKNNELKQSHYHILLHLRRSNRLATVRNWFTIKEKNINCLGQIVRDTNAILTYLTHENELTKYQYDESEIISNNIDFWKNAIITTDITMDIIKDMLCDTMNIYQLCKRYGKDFVYHYEHYKKVVSLIKYDTHMDLKKGQFNYNLPDNFFEMLDKNNS